MERYGAVVGGEDIAGDEWIDVPDPATGQAFAQVVAGAATEIDAAAAAAQGAFGEWSTTTPAVRGRVLRRLAALITAQRDTLAAVESRDTGKPMKQAYADVDVAARYFEFYAGAAEALHGDTVTNSADHIAYTLRQPVGVTGHIVPWNYPLQISARTVAPAIAAGNCSVLKAAEQAPLGPVLLARLARDAGLPHGVLNVVPGYGPEAGAALAGHPGISHLSFTGSEQVGQVVTVAAAANHVPVVLELGGKSPNIVWPDADLDAAVPAITNAILQNAGQTCSAGSRLLVHHEVHAELVDRLAQRFAGVRIGRGSSDPDLGPLISAGQRERVASLVAGAVDAGEGKRHRRCGPAGLRRQRVLLRADTARRRRRRFGHCPAGGLRTGPGGNPVRKRGRGASAGQRHAVRADRCCVDPKPGPRAPARPRHPGRADLRQHLRCRRGRRAPLRRREEVPARARERLRGPAGLHPAEVGSGAHLIPCAPSTVR